MTELAVESSTTTWVDVCPVDRVPVDRGVAALVGTDQVAVFRLADESVYAVDHVDPVTGAPVMARGLVGSVGDAPTINSPLHKECYDLRSGACLDDPALVLRTWPVRVVEGLLQLGSGSR